METLDLIITIAVAVLAFFKVIDWVKLLPFIRKVGTGAEKVATSMDSAAIILQGLGFEKPSMIVKEGADIVDELGDVAAKLAELTADGNFTKEDALAVLKEGKDVWVEMKDFRIKVFPKKE